MYAIKIVNPFDATHPIIIPLKLRGASRLKLPQMANEAYAIDEKNGYTLWQNDIHKEMENVKIAFQIMPKGKKLPNEFQYVNYHIVFDIKMED